MDLAVKLTHLDPIERHSARGVGGTRAGASAAGEGRKGHGIGKGRDLGRIECLGSRRRSFGCGSGAGEQCEAGHTAEVEKFPSCNPQGKYSVGQWWLCEQHGAIE